jgi:uncharacterized beta-barrel protein YwiB (DUF1934 family)
MTNNVCVSIIGLHETDGTKDTVQTTHAGNYRFMNQKHIISYKEKTEAADEEISCLLKIEGQKVSLTKKTAPATEMVFCPGELKSTRYHTPMGAIFMDIDTKKLNLIESPDEIRVEISYRLCMNETPLTESRITILISSTPSS